MIISDRLKKQLKDLEENINTITYNHSIVGIQLENFLKNFGKKCDFRYYQTYNLYILFGRIRL